MSTAGIAELEYKRLPVTPEWMDESDKGGRERREVVVVKVGRGQ
jgi:hypothetical protein